MLSGTVVVERQFHLFAGSILHGVVQPVDHPLQAAVHYVVAGRLRRSHRVAVLILHVAHRDIDVAVVQLRGRLINLDEYLVVLTDERELQVGHVIIGHHRCCLLVSESLQDDIFCIGKHVVAHQSVGRLLGLRVELIAWLALVVEIEFLAVGVGHQFEVVVLLALYAVETQVGLQTGLVAIGALRGIGADELLRQCLCKEHQFVHVARHSVVGINHLHVAILAHHVVAGSADERIAAADASQRVGLEGRAYLFVYIYISHVASSIDGHGEVVPATVAPVAGHIYGKAVRAVAQSVAFETDVELVVGTIVFLHAATVGEQRTATVGVSPEPEHQRVVLLGSGVQRITGQLHALVGLVQVERQATRDCPVDIYQPGVGTLC